jgi:hypothetical protein
MLISCRIRTAALERNLTVRPCVLDSAVERQNAPPGDIISCAGDSNVPLVAVKGGTRTSEAAASASDGQALPQILNEMATTRAEMSANIACIRSNLCEASALMSCTSMNSQLRIGDLINLVAQVSSKLDSIAYSSHPDACHIAPPSNTANALMAVLWLS